MDVVASQEMDASEDTFGSLSRASQRIIFGDVVSGRCDLAIVSQWPMRKEETVQSSQDSPRHMTAHKHQRGGVRAYYQCASESILPAKQGRIIHRDLAVAATRAMPWIIVGNFNVLPTETPLSHDIACRQLRAINELQLLAGTSPASGGCIGFALVLWYYDGGCGKVSATMTTSFTASSWQTEAKMQRNIGNCRGNIAHNEYQRRSAKSSPFQTSTQGPHAQTPEQFGKGFVAQNGALTSLHEACSKHDAY